MFLDSFCAAGSFKFKPLAVLSHDDLHWALSLYEDKSASLALTSQSY